MTVPAVKICGLRERALVDHAVGAGAAYVGFIFYPPSVRAVRPDDAASLMADVPETVGKVGVFVDPGDAELDTVLALCPLDFVQLHGGETPGRVADVAIRTGLRVIKALSVKDALDLERMDEYGAADHLMLDAKAPAGQTVPGGHGLPFDWRLLAGRRIDRPWFLAGGLTPENLGPARSLLQPPMVDVSSGVEASPGVKDKDRIDAFMQAARAPLAPAAPSPGEAAPGERW